MLLSVCEHKSTFIFTLGLITAALLEFHISFGSQWEAKLVSMAVAPSLYVEMMLTSCCSFCAVKMALKTKKTVNNEQWQPLQDDWPPLTGPVCVSVGQMDECCFTL
ncbi:hypothetical protein GOODEAATRI_003132 [Goodea atripinnis]|uniref:Uncharacterized protein n=1 Tax=Goodea atripinnis TaxID=208336 RepID=A0ABV0PAY1_9TELE